MSAWSGLRLVQYYFHTKELPLASLAYLGEQLTERVAASIRARAGHPAQRRPRHAHRHPADRCGKPRAYTGFYTLMFSEPELGERHGAACPGKLESLLGKQISAAQQAGEVAADIDRALTAAALAALTNGLGSSVLGGQRDGAAALRILEDQLARLFTGARRAPDTVSPGPGTSS